MDIITSLLVTGILIFVNALVLKLYVASKRPSEPNSFSRALKVTGAIGLATWALGFIPMVGWLLGPIVWFLVVRDIYRLSGRQSVALFFIQLLASAAFTGLIYLILFILMF